jgi:hypothetical protein
MTRYAVAILLALTMPARAADLHSANYVLPGCKGFLDKKSVPFPDEAIMEGYCVGFLEGLAYTTDFCQPKGVTTNQAIAVVVKYIEARPERMHEDFRMLALEALITAWPCKR